MSYNPNIPQPTDRPSASQSQMLINFGQANSIFGHDHVPFNDGTIANRGKHTYVALVTQAADPTGANFSAGQMALYTKTISGVTQLFLRRFGNTPIQISNINPVGSTNGYSYLPGGMLLQWGLATANSGATVIPFTIAFSSSAYNVQITQIRTGSPGSIEPIVARTGTLTSTDFTAYNPGSPHDIYWTAIGPK